MKIKNFITTRLDYCHSLYVGASQSSSSHLELGQNVASCFLTGTRKKEHITPVLSTLHCLCVYFRVTSPTSLSSYTNFLPFPTHSYQRNTAEAQGVRAFAIPTPKLWTLLALNIRQVSSLASFESALKTHFFCLAFDPV